MDSGPVMTVHVLRAKSRLYRRVGYQTNIPSTLWYYVHDGRRRTSWIYWCQLGKQLFQLLINLRVCLPLLWGCCLLDVQAAVHCCDLLHSCWVYHCCRGCKGASVMVQPRFPSSVCLCPPPSASAHLCLCPSTSVDVHLPSTTTLKHTCSVLMQLHCTCCQTNFRSRPNMSRLSPHTKGCHTYALFPICPIWLIPLHWQ